MNKIIILIIGIFVMAGLVYALATFTITGGDLRVSSLQKGLVGHWALDGESYDSNTERITDKTPYENHGTNYGAVLTTDQMGQGNRAMSFDGAAGTWNTIRIYDDPALDGMDTLSVSTWVKIVSSKTHQIVYKRQSGSSPAWKSYELGVGADDKAYFRVANSTGYLPTAFSDNTLDLDKWYNLVGVYNGTHIQIYIDGIARDSTPPGLSGSVLDSDYLLMIGGLDGTILLNGSITDVRIYDRALSADEIDTLYHSYRPKASSGSLQKGLVLDMPLNSKYTKDETVGSEILTDRTPYSNDGQNYGATVGSDYTSFDGTDDNVIVTDFAYGPNFSVSFWFNVSDNSGSSWQYMISHGTIGSANSLDIMFCEDSTSGCQGYLRTNLQDSEDAYDYDALDISTQYADGTWHFYTLTVDSNGSSVYVDGVFKISSAQGGAAIDPATDMYIGSRTDENADRFTKGMLNEVRIYNRALSPSEIKLLYDKGR